MWNLRRSTEVCCWSRRRKPSGGKPCGEVRQTLRCFDHGERRCVWRRTCSTSLILSRGVTRSLWIEWLVIKLNCKWPRDIEIWELPYIYIFDPPIWSHFTYNKYCIEPNFMNVFSDKVVSFYHRNESCRNHWNSRLPWYTCTRACQLLTMTASVWAGCLNWSPWKPPVSEPSCVLAEYNQVLLWLFFLLYTNSN